MTGVALAINASAGAPEYSARDYRNAQAALMGWSGSTPLAGRNGLRPMGGTAANIVTLSGSTITVNLHTGTLTPGWAATTGSYEVALTAVETHALTPANATNPRKDIVVGRVYDHDENPSSMRLYRTEYIAGAAGPSPSEPAVPVGAVRIATIDVPASGGGSPVVTNNYPFAVAAGGILPVRNQAERDAITNPAPGLTVFRMDLNLLETATSAGAWRVLGVQSVNGPSSAVTSPSTSTVVFDVATMNVWRWMGTVWGRALPYKYPEPAQSATGNLDPAVTVTYKELTIPTLGYAYKIRAKGSVGWASNGGNANELINCQITLNSAALDTNVVTRGLELTHGIPDTNSLPTVFLPEKEWPIALPGTSPVVVRLLVRKFGVSSIELPGNSPEGSMTVEIVPADVT